MDPSCLSLSYDFRLSSLLFELDIRIIFLMILMLDWHHLLLVFILGYASLLVRFHWLSI